MNTATKTRVFAPARVRNHLLREEDGLGREQEQAHVAVLLQETIALLNLKNLKKSALVVDATAGAGGHSEAILAAAPVRLLALDADPAAAARVHARLARHGARATIVEANFRDLAAVLAKENIKKIDAALFDLGWSREQLWSGRGFSFLHDESLNMSYGPRPVSGFTAADILNTWGEKVLADVFFGYGEERYARRIARAVVERRKIKKIATSVELAEIIRDAVPAAYRRGRLHPATKSFQALRSAVNDELGSIERGVAAAWEHLAPGGRMAVITFHSVEDRAVKRLFVQYAKHAGRLVVKKPVVPQRQEIINNPASRSAKLRVIEKI